MKKVCTLCGCSHYDLHAFKNGHVCEKCLRELRPDSTHENGQVRINR